MRDPDPARARRRSIVLLAGWALVVLCLGWEWSWAPLREGGSLLLLKALPMVVLLPSLARSRRRAYQWTTLVVLLYVCEGLVRASSDPRPASDLALLELLLAGVVYVGAILWLRADNASRRGQAA
jgi:uncharacterized membrane protein